MTRGRGIGKARKSVKAFLETTRGKPHGGAPCMLCSHPRKREIEDAARAFNEQRTRWANGEMQENPETGEQELQGTNVTWERFVKDYLKPELGYNGSDKRALIRHLENHVGLKIA